MGRRDSIRRQHLHKNIVATGTIQVNYNVDISHGFSGVLCN